MIRRESKNNFDAVLTHQYSMSVPLLIGATGGQRP